MLNIFRLGQKRPQFLLNEADALGLRPKSILLASEGRRFSPAAIAAATSLANSAGGSIEILTIARIWGTGFGLPNPGLLPNSREWQEQRDNAASAQAALKQNGIGAAAEVLAARNAAKQILRVAKAKHCDLIIMAADKLRHPIISGLLWSQEPHRVRRLASIPVFLVQVP